MSREKHKLQFVCNKEGHGRVRKKKQDTNAECPDESDKEDCENEPKPEAEPENGGEGGVKKKKLDGGRSEKGRK